jgi:hypothetical protein
MVTSAKFVGKSVNILLNYNITNTIETGTDILFCINFPLLYYDFLKNGLIFKTDGVLTTKNKMEPDTYIFPFSYIV